MLLRMWSKGNNSFIAGGSENLFNHLENQLCVCVCAEKQKKFYLKTQLYHQWAYTQMMLRYPTKHLLHYVHRSFIHNRQKLERYLSLKSR